MSQPLDDELPEISTGDAATGAWVTRNQKRRRGFGGFSWLELVGGPLVIGAVVWGAWTTRELLELRERRIVSVSLAAMANDFVMAEARAGISPEQIEVDTRHYTAALQSVLKERVALGETIFVSEAVVSGSVPDITPQVREAVGKLMTSSPAPRVPAQAPSAGQFPGAGGVGPGPATQQVPSLPMTLPVDPPAAPQGGVNAGPVR